ncbi:hypothetical protein [Mycobacterium sp. TY815]|uniref:hypothetical protein n=1 Tax=Mycobacterium sp. TY815 TaxID=3050581 RepID=UPI002741326F|nr:hypothetical protein [Mycobacterium sp. TY815]MDP7707545.1 hypothetical protein [Mycobacterium sp. TY815]
MKEVGKHAVVLGAGMAGLVAAGVLSEFYDSVTVVERDTLPDRSAHRRGIPQGHHVHILLSRGIRVLSELFPGLPNELASAGAAVVDDGDLSRVYVRNGPYELKRSGTLADPAALAVYLASRPFLEFHVRRRVAALINVRFLDGHDVAEPIAEDDAIIGVRVVNRDNGVVTAVNADLVVDSVYAITEPTKDSVKGVTRLETTVQKVKLRPNPRLELAKIIISRRQNKGEHIDRERELREAYGDLVTRTVIPDLGARQDAHSAEVPMHKFKGGRALSLQVAYDDLLDELGITIGANA